MSSSLRRAASPARRPSRTRIMTTARSRAPIAVAGSHTPSKAATCSAPTPRGSPTPRPGRLEDPGGQVPVEAAGAQRPPQQAADRIDDVSTGNNAVRASPLGDVGVDDRRIEPVPLHRARRRRQPVKEPGGVVAVGRDGLLGQTTLVTHPRTPVRHRSLGRRELTHVDLGHPQIASGRKNRRIVPIELFTVTQTKSRERSAATNRASRSSSMSSTPAPTTRIHKLRRPSRFTIPAADPARVALRSQPIRAFAQHRRRQGSRRHPRNPNRDAAGPSAISSSRTSPPDTPCLKRDRNYATMPTFRTSAPLITCAIARVVGIVRRSA